MQLIVAQLGQLQLKKRKINYYLVLEIVLFLLQIDYRTQAKAGGHPVDGSDTSRVLNELVSRRAARVESVRRHGPIIAILV